ncbi:uracil-DNA glycosylase [Geothrix sp.]|uniref:uracil-DNA glycosylase n=2 Tax=Geothrix sp. TaxID=1962974 RepID=UPI00261CE409|nr:uracil-DNA glycosylase [Geothrix sp.]WIL21282.1 MAG: uracil-DNA glycosylase [Geothrix sp.]
MTDHPLQAWRDTLEELGVMGLVREPVQVAPVVATDPPPTRQPAVRPAPAPAPRPAAAYAPPTDPIGCPTAQAVAGATSLQELQLAIQGCLACPLGPGRLKFVFGEGDPLARLMFVGEGPGRDEDLQGRPFVGKAGELLDKMIGAIGLKREDVYIGNIVKCRPPDNRTPTPEEARACLGYLHRQIELIRPTVIVTLGATPLRELVGVSEGITRVRGQWKRVVVGNREIPVMPTFHPAYVLRQYTQDVRRAVWEDLKAAKEWVDKAQEG